MKNPSFATRWNADLIDENYNRWLKEPDALDSNWRAFFEGFELARDGHGIPKVSLTETANGRELATGVQTLTPQAGTDPKKQARFTGAIYAFRSIGHTQGRFNPIKNIEPNVRLSLERLGFSPEDLDSVFDTGNYLGGVSMPLRQLLENLEATYCHHIAVEYLHIQETHKRRWLQSRIEPTLNKPRFSPEKKLRILEKLLYGEIFEQYLHTRYVGQKRFGLEGGETLIPSLDALLEYAPELGIDEIVMGMAHRGRLNVLANIFGKSYEFLFNEFSANYVPDTIHGDGDVKYHLGYTAEITTSSGKQITMYLAANPSHLEAVNPVVEGRARARQRILGDVERKKILPVLIHGDAAFAGQGLVCEVLNLSKLKGYTTGGTIHFIINNQIGFTTDPTEARSSRYCTDVAKMIEAPIFHVNGDDPQAMVMITELALSYRQEFGDDVVIDMYCYRRHGHNEADEPAFTQPKLYKQISEHPLTSETYMKQLREEGDLTEEEVESVRVRFQKTLDSAFHRHKVKYDERQKESDLFSGADTVYQPPYSFRPVKTSVKPKVLEHVAKTLTQLPADVKANPKIKRQLDNKWKAFTDDTGIDWAFAESLAWGTLMLDGTPVRLSGQDCARGTFSQRHAVIYDTDTREPYIPLMNMDGRRAILCVHNSLLSEAAVLGFDYGYSLDYPQMLCMWEAQFGDFANGAQVIIDQFLSSSESKWMHVSSLVLLLPHGYEGQGPEHSSARPGRFLQACAEDNMQVCNMTTPVQLFHVLRRQTKRDFKKPLIVMAPKSLLRHKQAVSRREEFTSGSFQEIIDDGDAVEKAKRVILCSGKIYYELNDYKIDKKIKDSAILRVEQLYPLNTKRLEELFEKYQSYEKLVWCQEESQNMGAWPYIAPLLEEIAGRKPLYAGRDSSASPAVGSLVLHKAEQSALVEAAFTL